MSAIVVAPFSNSGIRDWPTSRYRATIELLLDRLERDVPVKVIGLPNQKLRANEIVRHLPVDRVVNACGRFNLGQMTAELRAAACVIGNNSGVAHLAGFYRVPTVCVFGGTHQRHEWRALGPTVLIVSRVIGCSPCQLDHGNVSPYDKACLREIAPETVADAVFTVMRRVAAMRAGSGTDRMPVPASPGHRVEFGGSDVRTQ